MLNSFLFRRVIAEETNDVDLYLADPRPERDIKQAISQARRLGYIRYNIEEYAIGKDADLLHSDPFAAVLYPAIFIALEDSLSKELDKLAYFVPPV